jgi:hypothetical protein
MFHHCRSFHHLGAYSALYLPRGGQACGLALDITISSTVPGVDGVRKYGLRKRNGIFKTEFSFCSASGCSILPTADSRTLNTSSCSTLLRVY